MHVLVKCDTCNTTHDTGSLSVGEAFRCICGEILRSGTRQPSQESRIVRCGSCGSPIGDGETCDHCGSRLSIFEKDLHTLCAGCHRRISDRSKYCRYCGDSVSTGWEIGGLTGRKCPSCDPPGELHGGWLDSDAQALECGHCAGLWLDLVTFESFRRRASDAGRSAHAVDRARSVAAGGKSSAMYRKCIHCGDVMTRKAYARTSGVIVDVCRNHGIWFDTDELGALLRWIGTGGGRDRGHQSGRGRGREGKPMVADYPMGALGKALVTPLEDDWDVF